MVHHLWDRGQRGQWKEWRAEGGESVRQYHEAACLNASPSCMHRGASVERCRGAPLVRQRAPRVEEEYQVRWDGSVEK